MDVVEKKWRWLWMIFPALIWLAVYFNLQYMVDLLINDVAGMDQGRPLTEAIRFFLFEVPKVFLLLVSIIFIVGIIRSFFTRERTRRALEGRSLLTGNVMAALLGVVTPFCSCSAIPLFLGFIESGIPLGVTFSFLIAAPMINEVAVVLLFGLFGWKISLAYVSTGLVISILAGWIMGKLRLEKYLEPWVYSQEQNGTLSADIHRSWSDRIRYGLDAVKRIVGKVWPYIVIGIAVGAAVHGYVPEQFMSGFMQQAAWYTVPLAVLIGIPLYSNAAGIIPIVSVLIGKGVPVGTALAFMMSVIGISLPELIILRKVLTLRLIFIFVAIVATGILLTGFLFNLINI